MIRRGNANGLNTTSELRFKAAARHVTLDLRISFSTGTIGCMNGLQKFQLNSLTTYAYALHYAGVSAQESVAA